MQIIPTGRNEKKKTFSAPKRKKKHNVEMKSDDYSGSGGNNEDCDECVR